MTPSTTDDVQFSVLGTLEVRARGVPVTMRQGLNRAVLLALLLRPNHTVSTDVLIDDLYGEELPAHPLNALQVQVSYLRRALADAGVDHLLVTEASGYRLAVDASAVDAGRFEALVDRARRLADDDRIEQWREALGCVEEALALWRGEPLGDVAYRDFAAGEIARLGELRLGARELRAELRLSLGHHREVAPELQALADEHPLRERVRELLMLALYRAGRQADTLREYEATRRALGDQLGLEPGPELRRLERAILDHDPALDWSAAADAVPAGPPPSVDRRAGVSTAPLPAPVAGLIGRSHDLTQIAALLERSRAVTLTGTGGSGKTRLAIEVARGVDDPCWFVDLGPVDANTVRPEIATAFGLTIRSGDDTFSGVAALAPAGLLVLDTCEHVVDAAAEVVASLLRQCPALRVLSTSRRPLEVVGELVWPVTPLALPDRGSSDDRTTVAASPAVQLLLERANGARPEFELTEENASAVAAICRALDGLPLGIELAAARLDVLSPADLHRRLDDRFTLLDAGSRDAAARQRTLRAAVDWSYELLTSEERLTFHRLAVLPGPFGVDLACAVIDGAVQADPLDLLRSLVRQSMVTRQGPEQFGILDTLQAYAHERADTAETVRALDALTDWAADVTEDRDRAVRGAAQHDALAAFRRDVPNLRAALEWSLTGGGDPQVGARIAGRIGWFWHLSGMYEEGHRWSVLAAAVPDLSPAVRVSASIGAGLHATALGLLDEARAYLGDAVAVAEDRALPEFAPRARAHRGDMEWWFDDPDAADADLSAAAAASAPGTRTAHPWVHAFALLHLGRVRLRQQRYDEANALFDEAEPLLGELGDAYLAELALRFRARGATIQGDPAAAVGLAARALEHAERLGHTEGIAISLLALGEGERALGHLDEAATVLRRSVEFSVAADHVATVCQGLGLLAAIEADTGDRAGAAELLEKLLPAQAAAGLPLLTPGGVVQGLVDELLGGRYPTATSAQVTAARGRADIRALALSHLD